MPLRLLHLIVCFLAFYFLWDASIHLFTGKPLFTIKSFRVHNIVIAATGIISFFLYPLAICFILARLAPQRPGWSLTLILLCIPVIILFRYLLQEMLGPLIWGFSVYYQPYTFGFYFRDNLYFAVLYSCFGFIYFIVQYTKYSVRQQAELAMAVKEAELALLKSQINPHFLFNNLSNIYTLIYRKDENALTVVEKLSSLLRYALYEHRDKVTLETELTYLKNYVELQRLRIDASENIHVDLEDIDGTLLISPHLLVSFSENAFKYGDMTDPEHPLTINAHTEGATLFYQVSNKKSKFSTLPAGGIGLNNVKRRLELLYPDRHTLKVTDSDLEFIIDLCIKL